ELTVEVNAVTYTEGDGNLTDNGDGTWTLQRPDGSEIAEGVYDVVATATDLAGNTSTDTTVDELTVDTTAPTIPTVDEVITTEATPKTPRNAHSEDEFKLDVDRGR